jgi:hypothetical protein
MNDWAVEQKPKTRQYIFQLSDFRLNVCNFRILRFSLNQINKYMKTFIGSKEPKRAYKNTTKIKKTWLHRVQRERLHRVVVE